MATSAKLLLAEDSLTIQKVFEMTFQQSGISLTMVDNGIDAVRLAREISPDLVVADVSLPGKDGFHVASELRSPAAGVSCPVLILAGTLSPFAEEEKGAGAPPVSPAVKADDRGGAAPSSAGGALSLKDFDVSLEDIEGKPERKETAPQPTPPKQEEQDPSAPYPDVPEERFRTVEHIEEPAFDDSPPAVTDLTSALESALEPV